MKIRNTESRKTEVSHSTKYSGALTGFQPMRGGDILGTKTVQNSYKQSFLLLLCVFPILPIPSKYQDAPPPPIPVTFHV